MHTPLADLNRILRNHSFYPLVLSSLMACAFFAFRVVYSGTKNYSNLLTNLFLAWLPYIFSVVVSLAYRSHPNRWGVVLIFGMLWLIFFPNAPYMVTDFYHLNPRPPIPLWFDISLIAIFAFTGCFLAIASLRSIHNIVERFLGKFIGWVFALFSLGLGSLGVYLGRFSRFNSWDILLNPRSVITDITHNILNPLDNLGFIGFTLMFTAILLVFYLMFTTATNPKDAA
ncbi:MAG: DUF1361 domain-containing protein [Anaerolineales bacterium]